MVLLTVIKSLMVEISSDFFFVFDKKGKKNWRKCGKSYVTSTGEEEERGKCVNMCARLWNIG